MPKSRPAGKRKVEAIVNQLKQRTLGKIRHRLRKLAWRYAVEFVAFRLSVMPERAEALLAGKVEVTLDDMSDLALAAGCTLEPKLVKRAARRLSR